CSNGYFDAYYQALSAYPTKARENKLLEIFSEPKAKNSCYVRGKNTRIILQKTRAYDPESKRNRDVQKIFVLHKPGTEVTGEDLAWTVTFHDKKTRRFVPEKINTISLDDRTLSVFTAERANRFPHEPYEVFGRQCIQN
ncbi:MAG: hypothetical protein ABFQ82_06195, partial [Thermodesulfobacteriota bacterium]